VASLLVHVLLLGLFPFLIANFRSKDETEPIEVVFYPRPVEGPEPAPLPVDPAPPEPEVARVESPEPEPTPQPVKARSEPRPVPEARPEPKPTPPRPAPEPRAVTPAPAPVVAEAPRPEPPRREVRTDVFQETRPDPVVTKAAVRETRTGSFGEPETAVARTPTDSRLRGGTTVGGFEVAQAPSATENSDPERRLEVAGAGFGEATTERVAVEKRSVSRGSFGDTVVVEQPRRERRLPAAQPDTPVEILSKPRPAYTAEAREMKVEGEVVLEVVFVASGRMRVVGVVEGLGHGLDEAAIEAARNIEFKPARRDGQPVDHAAVLRIVFQLA